MSEVTLQLATEAEVQEVREDISQINSKLSEKVNSTDVYTKTETDTKIKTVDDKFANSFFIQKMQATTGIHLGNSFTSEQDQAIRAGDFKYLPLSGYWTIGGHNWRIFDGNWYKNKGDIPCTDNHLTVMPDDNLLKANGSTTHYMNDTDTTAGGYKGTKYRSVYRAECDNIIKSCFGANSILTHRELICTSVDANGKPNGWEWVDATSELPSEVMMYGSTIWSNYTDGGSGYNVGTAYPQLALARICPEKVINRENYWLRDAVSASGFAYVDSDGGASYIDASNPWIGVRPYFLLV